MTERFWVDVVCPYCKLEQRATVPAAKLSMQLYECDPHNELGGCSRHFVIRSEVEISVEAKGIEGQLDDLLHAICWQIAKDAGKDEIDREVYLEALGSYNGKPWAELESEG